MTFITRSIYIAALLFLFTITGCKKYLEVPLPINSIDGSVVFNNDNTSAAALNSVYAAFYSQGIFDGTSCPTYMTGLYGDELKNYSTNPAFVTLYKDAVSTTTGVTALWTSLYKQIYSVNLGIESLPGQKGLTYKNQWLGEAYFLRGLMYFYLTNLYGDAPLVLSSDYLVNNNLKRSSQADVYAQIVADLKQAQTLLDDNYHDDGGAVTNDRGRPNRMAATALLAKTYLYMKDWPNAEVQADSVIGNTTTYQLPTPDKTFLVGSPELIWGIAPYQASIYPYEVKDAVIYYLPPGIQPGTGGLNVTMSDSLNMAFEPGDLRYTDWVGVDTVPASGSNPQAIYHYPHKYKATGNFSTPQESIVLFRLAEQYLIRAEARAQQNKLAGPDGAIVDLNIIRTRATLLPTTASLQTDVLNAIQKERRVELFAEQGHRFFDLRRTGTLDALMTVLAPLKGGNWASFEAYWPIPLTDIENNKSLTQTPGYQ